MTGILIISLYFLIVIAIGIYSSFKIKNSGDYYVAGKKGGFWQVGGSLFATILGSSALLGTIEMGQNTGWPAVWFLLSASFGLFLLVPFAGKVKRAGNYTLPQMLEKFYGKPAARISSLIIPIAWTGVVAAQIIGASKILDGLGFFSYQTGAIFSGVVFIVYTLLGGQVSILKTDLFQAFLIISGVLLIFAFAYTGTDRVGSNHSDPIMLFNEKFGFFDLFILVFTYSVTFLVGPDIYSRLFCAKNEHTARITVLTVAVLLIPMAFMLTFLGRYSHQINDENIMAFAQHLLPDWGFALFIAALLSAVMSSADTTLLTSAIILSGLVNDDLDRRESTRMTHLFVLLIGIISIVIALKINSIIGSLLFALSFFSGAFVVPVLSGLLNIKVNREKVVAAILAGGLTALAGKITATFIHPLTGNLMIIFSFVINALILFIGNSKKSY